LIVKKAEPYKDSAAIKKEFINYQCHPELVLRSNEYYKQRQITANSLDDLGEGDCTMQLAKTIESSSLICPQLNL